MSFIFSHAEIKSLSEIFFLTSGICIGWFTARDTKPLTLLFTLSSKAIYPTLLFLLIKSKASSLQTCDLPVPEPAHSKTNSLGLIPDSFLFSPSYTYGILST